MEGKLIASVLVPAQTQLRRQKLSEGEQAAVGGLLFAFVVLVICAMAFQMRQSKNREEQAKQAEEQALAKQFHNQYPQTSTDIINKADEEPGAAEEETEGEKAKPEDDAAAERKNLRIQMAEQWERANIEKIKEHKYALYKDYSELVSIDNYGNYDFDDWLQPDDIVGVSIYEIKNNLLARKGFHAGFTYFWKNILIKGDFQGELWFEGWHKYRQEKLGNSTDQEWWEVVSNWVFDYALIPVGEELETQEDERTEAGYSEDMSGADYEIYCGRLLQEAGWNVEQTQASNDQGVDLIAQIEDLKVCIQCKRYSNPVGNKAVQEVIAGKAFYNGTHAVVVSNAGFTKAAKSLAESADVILISDTELEDLETMV